MPRPCGNVHCAIYGKSAGLPYRSGDWLVEERKLRQLLLIDDEPAFGRFIAHAAETGGYSAHITMSAEPFMRKYRELLPDAVAIDLAMPRVDGVELLRFLSEQKCEAPVIIVSGFDRRVLESSMRLGTALGLNMVGPLEKPVRLQTFLDLLAGLEDPGSE